MRRAFAIGGDEWPDSDRRDDREREQRAERKRHHRMTERVALDAAHDHLDAHGMCCCWAVKARPCPHRTVTDDDDER